MIFTVAMLAWPAGTSAATIGHTGTAIGCQDNRPWVPDSDLASYTAPVRGVITSWSTMGSATANRTLELMILQSQGAHIYAAVQKDQVRPIATNVLNTFTVQLPMQAGQVLGLFAPAGQPGGLTSCAFSVAATSIRTSTTLGEPAIGTPVDYNDVRASNLNVSAEFQPDSDGDLFGDDTQDKCVGTAGTFNGCPSSVTLDAVKQKGKKPKLKVSVTVPGAGTLKAGSPTDPALAAAAATSTLKPVTQTLTATTKQTVELTLKLTKTAKLKLSDKGKLKTQVKVVYTPAGGPPAFATRKGKLRS
jgi:hypothetical protein